MLLNEILTRSGQLSRLIVRLNLHRQIGSVVKHKEKSVKLNFYCHFHLFAWRVIAQSKQVLLLSSFRVVRFSLNIDCSRFDLSGQTSESQSNRRRSLCLIFSIKSWVKSKRLSSAEAVIINWIWMGFEWQFANCISRICERKRVREKEWEKMRSKLNVVWGPCSTRHLESPESG